MADQGARFLDKLTPKQRQFLTLGGIAFLLFGVLWAVFSITDTPKQPGAQASVAPGQRKVTNVGVMAPGAQLDPREKWIGEAGKDVAQLKQDRDQARGQIATQERFNQEILNRFDALKQDLARAPQSAVAPAGTSPAYPPNGALTASSSGTNLPPNQYRVSFNRNGNCSSPNGFSAGRPWAPDGMDPYELIPLFWNPDGNAEGSAFIRGVHTTGENGVAGRSVVIYWGSKVTDAYPDVPNNRTACGVFQPAQLLLF